MTTIDEQLARELDALSAEAGINRGFGSDFRDLARRRRFQRDRDLDVPAAVHPPAGTEIGPRLSDDPYSVITELSRLAERLVDARERLAVERTRAEHAERELAATHQRVIAARSLVIEAQRVATEALDRASFAEGRCDGLELALDEALHASLITRWRWRRSLRRRGD